MFFPCEKWLDMCLDAHHVIQVGCFSLHNLVMVNQYFAVGELEDYIISSNMQRHLCH